MVSVPPSGFSVPTIIFISVVLPAPFGPITPTMPPGGSAKVSPSKSSLSPKPFFRSFASTTTLPSRGPGGISSSTCSDGPSALFCSSSSFSYAWMRAFGLATRARGDMRIQSSSRASVRCRETSAFSSSSIRFFFWSSQLE